VLYLASKSPRRRELLKQLGVEFETLAVDIEEIWDGKESARDYVSRLALDKAIAGKALAAYNCPVLASDTEVVLDDQILGKPADSDHIISMLMSLSGRTHEVYTAVALLHESEQVVVSINQVSFKKLTEEECQAYCKTGEPLDKAGAYAIQGKAAAFIEKLQGSYSSVMGLPLSETAELLKSFQRLF
jgi:nucleoside triphosphate pyrophosphatase